MYAEANYSDWVYIAIIALFALVCHLALVEPKKHKKQKNQYNEIRAELPRISAQKATPKPVESPKKPRGGSSKPDKPGPSKETIKAMHVQADAERAIAEALERKAEHTPDPVKRARIARQAANSWLRFNKILDQIDKITQQ